MQNNPTSRTLHLAALDQIGKIPNFTPPSKHAAGRVGKKRPKRRNRRKP